MFRTTARRGSRPSRRAAAIAMALVGVAGLGAASAAQLSVTSGSLGAGTAVVASCQPAAQAIAVRLTSSFSGGAYRTTQVVLSGVSTACNGLSFRLRLSDAAGNPVGTEAVGVVTLTSGSFTVPVTATPAASIAGVALVIHG